MKLTWKIMTEPVGMPAKKVRVCQTKLKPFAIVYTPKVQKISQADIRTQMLMQNASMQKLIDVACEVRIQIFKNKPKSTSKKIIEWITRPDGDGIEELIFDCLKGLYIRDDAIIVKCTWEKHFTTEPSHIIIELKTKEDYNDAVRMADELF